MISVTVDVAGRQSDWRDAYFDVFIGWSVDGPATSDSTLWPATGHVPEGQDSWRRSAVQYAATNTWQQRDHHVSIKGKGLYEGRSINKLQNGAIPSVFIVEKIRNIRFVECLILNIRRSTTFLDDDVVIMTSADNRTQSIGVLFVPSVYHRNGQW